MSINSTYVHDLPLATDPTQFEIPGFDQTTNAGAKALMSSLKGDPGDAPNITITSSTLPYGSTPVVVKTGTNLNPNFELRFPLAKDGSTPMFQVANGYIQYRYNVADAWINLVDLETLKLHFSDLTQADIEELQAPAVEAANNANVAAQAANDAAAAANEAAANVQDGTDGVDGKTPVFNGGTASSLDPAQQPSVNVTQTGTDPNGNPIYTFDFGIPQGQRGLQGAPPVITNGTITTGAPGSDVNLNFTYIGDDGSGSPIYTVSGSIPQGSPGTGNGNVEVDATGLLAGTQYVFVPDANGSPIGTFQPVVVPDNQIQSDYAQTDTTAKDYIKNKPVLSTVATSGLYNDLLSKPNLTPNFQTDNSYSATDTGVTETINVRSIQNGIGTAQQVQLPVATATTAGVMPAPAYAQLQQNTADIQSIIAGGGKEWPSVATKADLDAFGMPAGATQNDVIKVRDDETQNGATTQYVATDNGNGLEWVFNLVINFDPVGIATITTPGIVQGSATLGKVFVEVDGTMSLMGYNNLQSDITTLDNNTVKLTGNQTINGVKTFSELPTSPVIGSNMPTNASQLTQKAYVDTKQPLLTSANAGENITIDTTNPQTPIINAAGGGISVGVWRTVIALGLKDTAAANNNSSYWIDIDGIYRPFRNVDVTQPITTVVTFDGIGYPVSRVAGICIASTININQNTQQNPFVYNWNYYNRLSISFGRNVAQFNNIVNGFCCNSSIEYLNLNNMTLFQYSANTKFCNLPNLNLIYTRNIIWTAGMDLTKYFQNIKNDSSCKLVTTSQAIANQYKTSFPNSFSNWEVVIIPEPYPIP